MDDEITTSALTNAQQIRLHSVKLAYRHDRSPEDILQRAKDLAVFVMGEASQAEVKPPAPAKSDRRAKTLNVEQVGPDTDLI